MAQLSRLKPEMRAPFDTDYEVNILVEIGSTIEADCAPRDDGTVPLTETLETVLGAMFEQGVLLDAVIAKNETERREIWERREVAAEVQLANPPFVNNDIALPLDRIAAFYDEAQAKVRAILPDAFITTVAHLGDGNLHLVVELGEAGHLKDAVMSAVEDVTLGHGGSFSAEHGIGLTKLPSMERRKDPVGVATMRAIKQALDPQDMMNPGKTLPKP
jgi:FAD/FMN-containing dehydrogenase